MSNDAGSADSSVSTSSLSTSLAFADPLVTLSEAGRSDSILIAGAGQLELLIALTRAGCASAACQAIDQAPHLGCAKADVVLAPAIRGEAELRAVLRWFAPHLRLGGILALRARAPGMIEEAPLRRMLREHGFAEIETRGADGARLWRARKRSAALARAA